MNRVTLGVVALTCAGVAACGGPLTDFSWSVELTAPLNDSFQVEFCPVATPANADTPLLNVFTPLTGLTVVLTVENDDIHTFTTLRDSAGGTPSDPTVQMFGDFMTFDIGPIGTVYDDNDPVPIFVGNTPVVRRFLSGSTNGSSEVELSYILEPECADAEIPIPGGTCTCEQTRVTWKFLGLD
jgi:hypothetical protein